MLAPLLVAVSESGRLKPERIAETLGVTLEGLAELVGTHRNSLHRVPDGPQVQKRLGIIVKILMTVTGMMADPDSDAAQGQAVIWFRHQPIPAFGGSTAADLVQAGHAEALLEHLHAMQDGGYA